MNDDAGAGRRIRRMWSPRIGLLAVVAGAALLTAACSGGGSSAPHVASLGSSSDGSGSTDPAGSSTTAPSSGNPTQLLDQWAACIRGHGDPSQVDPTIDSNKDIDINMNNVSTTLANDVHGSTGPCSNYLLVAENALRGGQPAPQAPSLAVQLKYAQCMRANGVPKYPDPNGSTEGTSFIALGIDPNSPVFQNADKACSKKVGMPYYAPGYEVPGVVIVSSCTAPPGKQCPSGGPQPGGGGNRPRPAPSGNAG
jgi:hypothetical protein